MVLAVSARRRRPFPLHDVHALEMPVISNDRDVAKVSAAISPVLGVYAVLAVASVWGAAVGALAACLAVLCAWAALHDETPPQSARGFAWSGAALAGLALLGFGILVVLALFGV
jgi:hypothetical protein